MKPLPQVSLPVMNKIHKEEIQLVGKLLDAIDEEQGKKITEGLEILLKHMQEHFDYEENMLKNQGFAMFEIHRNDHARIMQETRMAMMNWRNFKDFEALKDFIEEDFIEWLHLHIQAMDSVAADFLARQGVQ